MKYIQSIDENTFYYFLSHSKKNKQTHTAAQEVQ